MERKWSEKELKEIEENAYFKWIDAGRPNGDSSHFWRQAEKEYNKNEIEVIRLNYHAPIKSSPSYGGYYTWAPYVPLVSTPVVLNPNQFVDLSTVINTNNRYQPYKDLRDILAKEINDEIDREILMDLRNNDEEFWEVKQEIFKKELDKKALLQELVQVAAMCCKLAEDIKLLES